MAFPRKRRAAFTLTEVLMAAGILGIGLTMVASIFPVAVDQSRRSQDQTMAALCARSVMARVRVDRNAIIDGLRVKTDPTSYLNSDLAGLFPGTHIVYRPSVFLYNPNPSKVRTYDGVNTWDAGNYVARFFASRTSVDGPYRLTIFICRSIGKAPPSPALDQWKTATAGPGTYVCERLRGSARGYLLDYVNYVGTEKTGYFVLGTTADDYGSIAWDSTSYQCVPDAVAVFHTMLGE